MTPDANPLAQHPPAPTGAADILTRLEALLKERQQTLPAGSYTADLFQQGHDLQAAKLIEEAYELVEACAESDRMNTIHEAADLVFHLMVLLRANDISLSSIEHELTERYGLPQRSK
jgi:phosphoribosyl-ATP pyrophosphohydrolase